MKTFEINDNTGLKISIVINEIIYFFLKENTVAIRFKNTNDLTYFNFLGKQEANEIYLQIVNVYEKHGES